MSVFHAKEIFFSPCPRGLENVLTAELATAGAVSIQQVPGGALFAGSLETCYRVNLESRIATRVLWQLVSAPYRDENDLYHLAQEVKWPRLFSPDRTIRIHITATHSPLKSIEFATLRIKDAVCDRFRADTGVRPSVNTKDPDVRIHCFLTSDMATLYLDTSGEPLWNRGHKMAKVVAPLKENLAAGILRLIGWQPGIPLLDPMCGSGTFLLEAAGMALNDAPGLSRDAGAFGFERLSDFDPALWKQCRSEAAARRVVVDVTNAPLPIWGSDHAADAIVRTRQNLSHAGLDDLVTLQQADLLNLERPAPEGILIANPPYGERLGDDATLAAFYPRWGDALKKHFAGWNCWFLSADTQLPKAIGLSPKRKTPLFNGNLECRLYSFPVVAGSNRS
ncbi:MAG: THUMP domain-containing protein [Rhodocyclaceae bacterium]|nr:THUMP domain-containing protein [Rhodocyclaceae bacterium]